MAVQRVTTPARSTAPQGGFTVVEAMIASFLFVAIIVVTYSTMVVVMRYQATNDAEFASETAYRRVLDILKEELRDTSMERDPVTNLPRYQILTDGAGRQSLRFQKLVGAQTTGGEVAARWSTDIEISYDEDGRVYRAQDGRSIAIGSGVEELVFETTTSGKFKVTCVTRWRDPRSGSTSEVPHEILVKPLN